MDDKEYFLGYSDVSVHEMMIKDEARTGAYRKAILENPTDFAGRVVIDVGCGTGILSVFCALAGARKVYALEASNMAEVARNVVRANGLGNVISVVSGRAEEVELPESADVLISEWMGHMIFHERMLGTVLRVRDKYLKKGGKMFPAYVSLSVAPVCDFEFRAIHIDFWKKVMGINMTPLVPLAAELFFSRPEVCHINPHMLVAPAAQVLNIDLATIPADEIELFTGGCEFMFPRDGAIHGFAVWFSVSFCGSDTAVVLDTGPESEDTHWQQTVLHFDELRGQTNDTVEFSMKISQTHGRSLDIEISYGCRGAQRMSKFKFE